MFTIWHSIILGIVEGVTEFLPISSTGHMILVAKILQIPDTDFIKSFEITIQLGAILSVFALYAKKLWNNLELTKRVVVGFIPTGVIGLLLYKTVKTYLLGNDFVVLISLFVGGLAIVAFEKLYKEPKETDETQMVSYKHALCLGLFQTIAIIPGVSRSAATIICGLLLGYSRKTIVEFSFLLALPTMLAATGIDLIKNAAYFQGNQLSLLVVGFVTAFIVAFFAVRWLLRYVQSHSFISFGWYRMTIAIIGYFLR